MVYAVQHLDSPVLSLSGATPPSAATTSPLPGAGTNTSIDIINDPERVRATEKDELFYPPEGDMIVIQVEDRLFKVQRGILISHSTYFGNLVEYIKDGYPSCGSNDEEPLYLNGIRKFDFQHFLLVLQAIHCETQSSTNSTLLTEPKVQCIIQSVEHLTVAEWKVVLRLAKLWNVSLVMDKAIASIRASLSSSLEILEMGLELNIREWVAVSLRVLVTRDSPLSQSDVPWMDPTLYDGVIRAREHRLKALVLRLTTGEVRHPICQKCGSDFGGNATLMTRSDRITHDNRYTFMCYVCEHECRRDLTTTDVFRSPQAKDFTSSFEVQKRDLDFILRTQFPEFFE